MNRLCRLILLCLMALALPLQGLAAAGVLPCASGHLPGTHLGMAHGKVHGSEAHADCHGVSAPGSASATSPTAAAEPAADLVSTAVHKCSACAACGAGMALPASAPVLPSTGPEPAPVLSLEAAAASFIASGLERPPRSHLA